MLLLFVGVNIDYVSLYFKKFLDYIKFSFFNILQKQIFDMWCVYLMIDLF